MNVVLTRPSFGVTSKVADAIESFDVPLVENMWGTNDRVAFQVKLD